MRTQLLKLTRRKATKPERIVSELLKRNRISFRAKAKIEGREVDIICGRLIIEIGNHEQSEQKNASLLSKGYSLLTFSNDEVLSDRWQVEREIIDYLYGN